jgi:hypothetical protein
MSARKLHGAAGVHGMRVEQARGRLGGITAKLQLVIGLLLGGCSLREAAGRAGISRGTLYQWRRSEKFIAALESWRGDMEQAARSRLLNLSGMGLKAILRALEGGDAKVALALFKGLGIFGSSAESKAENVVIVRRAVERN